MNAALTTMRASDVMPGDCCRINGCWETVYGVGSAIDGRVTLLTESGDHTMSPTAQVETAEA